MWWPYWAPAARPPGKRNSSINMLSGGEKALTAVALVFSIFDLNPAPFCMLDEVDAPLDDHNVGRFCDVVKEMSERVQFIFITHKPHTMELAQNLLGVTMNEPGVSRLVAVDVDEALRLATDEGAEMARVAAVATAVARKVRSFMGNVSCKERKGINSPAWLAATAPVAGRRSRRP